MPTSKEQGEQRQMRRKTKTRRPTDLFVKYLMIEYPDIAGGCAFPTLELVAGCTAVATHAGVHELDFTSLFLILQHAIQFVE